MAMGETDLGRVITFNPQVVTVTTTLDEILRQWVDGDLHHWPVTNDQMRLLGIVSDQDVARAFVELSSNYPDNFRLGTEHLRARVVSDFMSTEVVTISRWDTQTNGLYRLLKNHVHSLPVIDENRLVGLVTTTDYLREFSYGELPISRQPVSQFVQDNADPVDCDGSLDDALAAMQSANLDQVGVVNGALPLGAITRRDIRLAQCCLESRRLLNEEFLLRGPTTLRELAAKSPTVPPGARISEAAALMVEHHRQAIAVVTQAGRMVGVLSEETVLTAMAGQKAKPAFAKN
jgi:CBS domain-containing protein